MGEPPVAAGASSGWSEGRFIQLGRHALHYRRMGRGTPLVLLHKLGGWTQEWTALALCLTDEREVIAIDLPGHGDSRADGPPAHVQTLEESSSAVMGVVDALSLKRFDLAGVSLGGAVAAVIAASWPQRVGRLIVLNAPLSPARTAEDVEAQDARTATDLWGEGDRPLPRSYEESMRQFAIADPAIHDDMNRSRAQAGPWVRASWRGAALGEVAGRLPRIAAPTLLLFGERRGPIDAALAAARSIPRAEIVSIPNAGAFPHQENPAAVAMAIRDHAAVRPVASNKEVIP